MKTARHIALLLAVLLAGCIEREDKSLTYLDLAGIGPMYDTMVEQMASRYTHRYPRLARDAIREVIQRQLPKRELRVLSAKSLGKHFDERELDLLIQAASQPQAAQRIMRTALGGVPLQLRARQASQRVMSEVGATLRRRMKDIEQELDRRS